MNCDLRFDLRFGIKEISVLPITVISTPLLVRGLECNGEELSAQCELLSKSSRSF